MDPSLCWRTTSGHRAFPGAWSIYQVYLLKKTVFPLSEPAALKGQSFLIAPHSWWDFTATSSPTLGFCLAWACGGPGPVLTVCAFICALVSYIWEQFPYPHSLPLTLLHWQIPEPRGKGCGIDIPFRVTTVVTIVGFYIVYPSTARSFSDESQAMYCSMGPVVSRYELFYRYGISAG